MSYLTLVSAQHLLTRPADPRECHRDVMSLFGQISSDTPRKAENILFRREHDDQDSVLIRSAGTPVRELEGMRTILEDPAPAAGSIVALRLAINAIQRSRTKGPNPKNIVVPVRPDSFDEDLADTMTGFLMNKMGSALESIEVISHRRHVQGRRRANSPTNTITIQHDMINAVAFVKDQVALQELMDHGVGRAKAYGCGLLTVRPMGGPRA